MWDTLRKQINETHKRLCEKPDSKKMGFACSYGGILNAYREGDLRFEEAIKQTEIIATNYGKTTIKLIPHDGGPCPVDGLAIVKTRDGFLSLIDSYDIDDLLGKHNRFWNHYGTKTDIIAYCPIEIEEGKR